MINVVFNLKLGVKNEMKNNLLTFVVIGKFDNDVHAVIKATNIESAKSEFINLVLKGDNSGFDNDFIIKQSARFLIAK
jgi:hypothetical protein